MCMCVYSICVCEKSVCVRMCVFMGLCAPVVVCVLFLCVFVFIFIAFVGSWGLALQV